MRTDQGTALVVERPIDAPHVPWFGGFRSLA